MTGLSLHTCPGRTNEHEQARTSNTARRTECNVIVKYNTQKRERDRGTAQVCRYETGTGTERQGCRYETGRGVSIRDRCVDTRQVCVDTRHRGYETGVRGTGVCRYEAGTGVSI